MRKIKIFLTMLAVAGVLFATSSCVDDSESASVTKLRADRSALLTAQANLAQAEITLRNAQAEALQIQAAAEALRAQSEKDLRDAQIAQTNAQTAEESARAAENLKRLVSDVERQIAENEAELKRLEIQLQVDLAALNAQAKIATATANEVVRVQLGGLLTEYNLVLVAINNTKTNLARNAISLAREELELNGYKADSANFVDRYIRQQKIQLANNESNIAANKEAILQWQAFEVDPNVEVELAASRAELKTVQDTLQTLSLVADSLEAVADAALIELQSLNQLIVDYQNIPSDHNYTSIGVNWFQTSTNERTTYTEWDVVAQRWVSETFVHRGTATERVTLGGVTYFLSGNSSTLGSVYSARTGANQWTFITLVYNNNFVPSYVSIEEYKIANANLKADSLRFITEIKELSREVDTTSKLLSSLAPGLTAAETAKDAALTKYQDSLDIFVNIVNNGGIPTSQDTARVQNLKRKYDGTRFSGAIPGNITIVDTSGNLLAAYNLARTKYSEVETRLYRATQNVVGVLNNYYLTLDAIKTYNDRIAILSAGSLIDLQIKQRALQQDREAKLEVAQTATQAYNDAEARADVLAQLINQLEDAGLVGIFTEAWGPDYIERSETFINERIAALETTIGNLEVANDNINERLANVTLYAGAPDESVALVIELRKAEIERLKAAITEGGLQLEIYEAELNLLKSSIDSLIATEE
jgi:hypothetical protein